MRAVREGGVSSPEIEGFLTEPSITSHVATIGFAAFCLKQSLHLFLKAKLLEAGVGYPRMPSVRRFIVILVDTLRGEGEALKT